MKPGVPPTLPQSPTPRRTRSLLVLALAAIVVLAALAYVLVYAQLATSGPCGSAFHETGGKIGGFVVNKSANGTEWILVLATETAAGTTPSNTCLLLDSPTGTSVLGATPLADLPGGVVNLSGSPGGLRIQYDGIAPGVVSGGDRLWIATLGTMISTQGLRVSLVTAGLIWAETVLE